MADFEQYEYFDWSDIEYEDKKEVTGLEEFTADELKKLN